MIRELQPPRKLRDRDEEYWGNGGNKEKAASSVNDMQEQEAEGRGEPESMLSARGSAKWAAATLEQRIPVRSEIKVRELRWPRLPAAPEHM